jgi:L-alanine-DL-glutamate epimerase-like enolase superfamily enzyme
MNFLNRRKFLNTIVSLPVLYGWHWTGDLSKDIKISRVIGFDLLSKRIKYCGKNAVKGEHGDTAKDRCIRVYTNKGIDGLGFCRLEPEQIHPILGKNPYELFNSEDKCINSVLGIQSMALWDLIGKIFKRPVYDLLGPNSVEKVPTYDGSIYFADLLSDHKKDPMGRFKEEIEMGFKIGHRGFKVKIGRGFKWMPNEEGYQRDLAVLKTIRQYAGPEILIGVDANNGYDENLARRLLDDLPDLNIAFVEELFPEEVNKYLALKDFIYQKNLSTLVADGESKKKPEEFEPFIRARAIDVLQGDMRRFGIEGILAESKLAEGTGIRIAPHNWGSLMGNIMQFHIGKTISNFYRAEHDPCFSEVVLTSDYEIKEGLVSIPNAPGFGLKIDETKFAKLPIKFDLKA